MGIEKVIYNTEDPKLRKWIAEVNERFASEGETIYKARNEIKVMEGPKGELLNVKRYKVPFFPNNYIYAALRDPKALRAFRNAQGLKELGICTPEPLGVVLYKDWRGLRQSYLVTRQIEFRRNMYEFGEGRGLEGRDEIVRAFGRFSAYLHDRGVLHLDYSPGNILFDEVNEGEYRFCLVDVNRMKFGEVSMEEGGRNFRRLWGGEPFFRILAEEYAGVRGFDQTETWNRIYHHRHQFWKGTSVDF